MRKPLARIEALEREVSPVVTLESSTRDLCRFLATLSVQTLREEAALLGPGAFEKAVDEIRKHVPGYAAEVAA